MRGRSTGRHYDIPVTYADIGSELFVLTEHKWRRNLHGGVDLDVTWHGQRTPMHAEVTETPEDSARLLLAIVQRLGWRAARRRFGLRTTDGESPTAADLRLLAATEDLAVLTLTSDETWRDGVVDGR